MNRRQLLKDLSILAGGAVCANSAWAASGRDDQQTKAASFATPVRGLVRKNGKLLQTVQLTVHNDSSNATAITRLNDVEVDRRVLSKGNNIFKVFTPAVSEPQQVRVDCEIEGKLISTSVDLQSVRKVLAYILPHSHHDLGYTDLQANVEDKQIRNISIGMDLARRTQSYPEGARFVWNLEVLWGADLFMRRSSDAEKTAFMEAVKNGHVSLNGMYANELTALCRPEELLQLFRFSHELGAECGVTVNSAMISDVPGYTWGTVTAMSQAGIRYFSAAPNFFDRIGTFMVEWQDKPFWWVSPSGKEKVLLWVPWTGYAMSHIMKIGPEWVGAYQDRLDAVDFPYDISYVRWSGHGDNAEPDPEICEFVKTWNEEYEWPKFFISSTNDAFSAFEKQYGKDLPQFKGDLTPYWEDGAGSSALETRMNRAAADRLTQAEALMAILAPASYQPAAFREAWRNVLLYSEHTWGAWCSVSDSENPLTKKQWDVKRAFAVDASKQSEGLLANVLPAHGTNPDITVIDVHNSTSWPRSEVVVVAKELSNVGDHVKNGRGVSVPSQRLSTGELAFLANDVPAFGTARFHFSAAKPAHPAKPVLVRGAVLDNGIVRLRIDGNTGDVVELGFSGNPGNIVDNQGGQALNQYLFLEGADTSKIRTGGLAKITVEEPGPLVASLRIESTAPGSNSLVRKIRLAAGADWLELTNFVDKKRAPLNPHPGQGGPGDDFAQHEAKESLQFAFPFAVPDGEIHMDIPLAVMRPEVDQLPGSCKNWLPVGRWIDIANANQGVTWVSLDAPLVEIGDMSANLLGSQRDPSLWRKHIAPTQKFFSWVMNNHWGTNYRAYQEGVVEFRYALRPHTGYEPAAASRLAVGLSQPLLASGAVDPSPRDSLLRIEPDDVLALTFKPSEDGKAWILRLFSASGEGGTVRLRWANEPPVNSSPRMWFSDLSERPLAPVDQEFKVAGLDLVTLRIERP